MARARLLHPNFFSDSDLLSLSPLHRLLFAGLWGLADKRGVLEDKPIEIKMRVLPVDNCDVQAMLADLDRVGRIVRYEVDGRRLILVRNFLRYQHPHPGEHDDGLPEPPRVRKDSKPRATEKQTVSTPKTGGDDPVSMTVSMTVPPPPSPSSEKPVVGGEKSETGFDCSTADGFRAWLTALRLGDGLPEEVIHSFEPWYARARADAGVDPLCDAYLAYRRDEHFRERGWPTAIFMSDGVWRPRAHLPAPERRHL